VVIATCYLLLVVKVASKSSCMRCSWPRFNLWPHRYRDCCRL